MEGATKGVVSLRSGISGSVSLHLELIRKMIRRHVSPIIRKASASREGSERYLNFVDSLSKLRFELFYPLFIDKIM
jgi:hypothetical protein